MPTTKIAKLSKVLDELGSFRNPVDRGLDREEVPGLAPGEFIQTTLRGRNATFAADEHGLVTLALDDLSLRETLTVLGFTEKE